MNDQDTNRPNHHSSGQHPPHHPQQRKGKSKIGKLFPLLSLLMLLLVGGVIVGKTITDMVKKPTDVVLDASGKEKGGAKDNGSLLESKSSSEAVGDDDTTSAQESEQAKSADGQDTKTTAAKEVESINSEKTKEEEKDTKNDKDSASSGKLVKYTGKVYHVFFHELIVDPDWLFSNLSESEAGGHNNVMTTLDEFNKMLESMYKKNFILINFNQLYDVSTDSDGTPVVTEKDLMLPEGKIPVIMSEDDVAFYQETRIDVGGYGRKYVLDENNKVKVYYVDKQGNESVGDYDVLPALETFCEKHPDFSYEGARAYIGLTGWEGAFGYRIGPDNENDANFEEDRAMVQKISKAARDQGFLFASHSYAHGNQETFSLAEFTEDTQTWDTYIGSYVGGTDTYILPKGNWFLKNEWKADSPETKEYWKILTDYGFRFICGVGCDTYRENEGSYVFMDRYNLDGFTMYNHKKDVKIFFDADKIWDNRRPGGLGLQS